MVTLPPWRSCSTCCQANAPPRPDSRCSLDDGRAGRAGRAAGQPRFCACRPGLRASAHWPRQRPGRGWCGHHPDLASVALRPGPVRHLSPRHERRRGQDAAPRHRAGRRALLSGLRCLGWRHLPIPGQVQRQRSPFRLHRYHDAIGVPRIASLDRRRAERAQPQPRDAGSRLRPDDGLLHGVGRASAIPDHTDRHGVRSGQRQGRVPGRRRHAAGGRRRQHGRPPGGPRRGREHEQDQGDR